MWREKILKKLAGWHALHPWRMLAVVLLVTIIMAGAAGQLKLSMRTSDLLPEKDPMVVQYNKVLKEFKTASSLIVVVQGEESRIKEFAEKIAPKILDVVDSSQNKKWREEIEKLEIKIEKLKTRNGREEDIEKYQREIDDMRSHIDKVLFQRVDYKAPLDFLRENMLMLVKEDDLKNLKDIFTNPNLLELVRNINDSMEKEYIGDQESISTREKEDGAVSFLDGIQNLVLKLRKAASQQELTKEEIKAAADKILFGDPYALSYDKTTLILTAVPTFTIMDRDYLMVATEEVQAIVDDLLQDYPGLQAGLTGSVAREHDEQVYSQRSLGSTTLFALIAILILLMVSFRMWVAPVLAIITLVVGLIWGMGTTFFVVGSLNMFTALMSVVLLGLGIDFSIHIISNFTERRAAGESIPQAMESTFLKSGKGVVTGALTTACAFLTLMVSQARGMREMGLVTGAGLLSILLATMLFLPTLLVFRARLVEKKINKRGKGVREAKDISFRFLGRMAEWLGKHYVFTIAGSVVISAFLIWSAFQIRFDNNFMNMEPESLASIELMDTVLEKFDISTENDFTLVDSVEKSRELSKKFRDLSTVAVTEDISRYLPSLEEQRARTPVIEEIRDIVRESEIQNIFSPQEMEMLKREIGRLEMNIIEIQDMAFLGGRDKVDNKCKMIVGDPDVPGPGNILRDLLQTMESDFSAGAEGFSLFQRDFAPYFKDSVTGMCRTETITLADLPESILDRYSNTSRNLFIVTVYPAGNLWEGGLIYRFVEDVEGVTEEMTGMPSLGLALLRVFGRDGRKAVLLTLVIVFLLLWIDFGKLRDSVIAMIPLALGIFWMVGVLYLSGQMLTIMNMMGLPLIIGIGIDDGVHIIHRWRSEGKGKIRTVFSSTGKAILLTSLTTMLAFGSQFFSVFPGWAQFGAALFIGVAACFLTTTLIIPGIIGFIERKKR